LVEIVSVNRDVKLFGREIIVEVFQPIRDQDGQTDDIQCLTALCVVASRGNKLFDFFTDV